MNCVNVLLVVGFLMRDRYGSTLYSVLKVDRNVSFEEFVILCFQNSMYFSFILFTTVVAQCHSLR